MTFAEAWKKLNEKKPVTGDVTMTPEQFKTMLAQFYLLGARHIVHESGEDKGDGALAACWKRFDRMMEQAGDFTMGDKA